VSGQSSVFTTIRRTKKQQGNGYEAPLSRSRQRGQVVASKQKGKQAMIYEKIVTLYDTAEHAEAARRNLEAAGFSPSEISMITNKTLTAAGERLREPGLWHRLFGRDIEQHEAMVYGRTVESGGAILTVRVAETQATKAIGILNAHKVADVQNRALQQGL
jgi:hypothetical protein